MTKMRLGEWLQQLGYLTEQDVRDVLTEQRRSGARFGSIALDWGLITAQQLWEAWAKQQTQEFELTDLDIIGVEDRALAQINTLTAWRYRVVPIRYVDGTLVIATADPSYRNTQREMPTLLKCTILFVVCTDTQLAHALNTYYPRHVLSTHAALRSVG